ncbi:MAG: hypothetical protein ACOX7C_02815 [Brevefilum sp.]|jgi:hypothetical protein
MRLGSILSKKPTNKYQEVEAFLLNKRGDTGQQVKLEVGKVMLNYFCAECDDLRTFESKGNITCIFVNQQLISIDTVLSCGCGTDAQAWFLIESENEINGLAPRVRIVKRSEKLSEQVAINTNKYGDYTMLLNKAEQAYREGLGAGSIVYLRKAFEKITVDTAKISGIEYDSYPRGNPKNFSGLLRRVDTQCSIIPNEFSADGYRLFRELSTVVHGEYDEELGLRKFEALNRLVIGILENVKNREELYEAIGTLGWDK